MERHLRKRELVCTDVQVQEWLQDELSMYPWCSLRRVHFIQRTMFKLQRLFQLAEICSHNKKRVGKKTSMLMEIFRKNQKNELGFSEWKTSYLVANGRWPFPIFWFSRLMLLYKIMRSGARFVVFDGLPLLFAH